MRALKSVSCFPALLVSMLTAGPAAADAIDGHWCRGLLQLFIDGPRIVTPGGTDMIGEYDRHGFRYIVPDNETNAGTEVLMMQLSEELMHLTTSLAPAEIQEWRRCKRQIS